MKEDSSLAENDRSAAPSVLLALAARCEREESNNELDRAIFNAVVVPLHLYTMIDGRACLRSFMSGELRAVSTPRYTASLDVATALIPSEFHDHWGASRAGKDCIAHVGNQENEGPARTPALALCAAALRIRAEILTDGTPVDKA